MSKKRILFFLFAAVCLCACSKGEKKDKMPEDFALVLERVEYNRDYSNYSWIISDSDKLETVYDSRERGASKKERKTIYRALAKNEIFSLLSEYCPSYTSNISSEEFRLTVIQNGTEESLVFDAAIVYGTTKVRRQLTAFGQVLQKFIPEETVFLSQKDYKVPEIPETMPEDFDLRVEYCGSRSLWSYPELYFLLDTKKNLVGKEVLGLTEDGRRSLIFQDSTALLLSVEEKENLYRILKENDVFSFLSEDGPNYYYQHAGCIPNSVYCLRVFLGGRESCLYFDSSVFVSENRDKEEKRTLFTFKEAYSAIKSFVVKTEEYKSLQKNEWYYE